MRLHFPWWLELSAYLFCAVPAVWFSWDLWHQWKLRRRDADRDESGIREKSDDE